MLGRGLPKHAHCHDFSTLPAALHNSILKCDEQIRKDVYSNLIVCGGNSLFPRTSERLLSYVINEFEPTARKIISGLSVTERKWSGWVVSTEPSAPPLAPAPAPAPPFSPRRKDPSDPRLLTVVCVAPTRAARYSCGKLPCRSRPANPPLPLPCHMLPLAAPGVGLNWPALPWAGLAGCSRWRYTPAAVRSCCALVLCRVHFRSQLRCGSTGQSFRSTGRP